MNDRHIGVPQSETTVASDRIAALFEQALACSTDERERFLMKACGGDRALYAELTSLLAAHELASGYFEQLADRCVTPAMDAITSQSPDDGLLARVQLAMGNGYVVERELSGGGMSRVFLADELRLGRKVVVKVLREQMAPGLSAERFQHEIQLAAKLQHPHIVPVLSANAAEGLLYFTMPYVVGETLRHRLVRDGALPLNDAIAIWRDVLEALAHAHAAGVVHRDIKPENILLSADGRSAVVADFGIARAIDSAEHSEVRSGFVLGTPAYMAPEQLRGEASANHRVDLYAAGLVMYEMLAGKTAFGALTSRETMTEHVAPAPQSLFRQDVPHALAARVMQCLEKDPTNRPESANEILATLADPSARRSQPFSRRARVGMAAGSLALVAAMTALAHGRSRPVAADSVGPVGRELLPRLPAVQQRRTKHVPTPEAYELYRRGQYEARLKEHSLTTAIAYYSRAVAADSEFAPAYAALAQEYALLTAGAGGLEYRRGMDSARAFAQRAIELDDSLPEAYEARAFVKLLYDFDWKGVDTDVERAAALNPYYTRQIYVRENMLIWRGQFADAVDEIRRELVSDPLSASTRGEFARARFVAGDFVGALATLDTAQTLETGQDLPRLHLTRGEIYLSQGRYSDARHEFQRMLEASPDPTSRAFLAITAARSGDHAGAEQWLRDLLSRRTTGRSSAFLVALAYAGLHDKDQAFAWLDSAYADRSLRPLIMDPTFAELRGDPRFGALLRRIGLGQ